jgi:hypothetical protein
MPRRVAILMRVEMRADLLGGDLLELAEKRQQVFRGSGGIVAADVQLRPITRRHYDCFTRGRTRHQRDDRPLEAAAAEVKTFTKFNRRRAMAGTDQE